MLDILEMIATVVILSLNLSSGNYTASVLEQQVEQIHFSDWSQCSYRYISYGKQTFFLLL